MKYFPLFMICLCSVAWANDDKRASIPIETAIACQGMRSVSWFGECYLERRATFAACPAFVNWFYELSAERVFDVLQDSVTTYNTLRVGREVDHFDKLFKLEHDSSIAQDYARLSVTRVNPTSNVGRLSGLFYDSALSEYPLYFRVLYGRKENGQCPTQVEWPDRFVLDLYNEVFDAIVNDFKEKCPGEPIHFGDFIAP